MSQFKGHEICFGSDYSSDAIFEISLATSVLWLSIS